MIDLENAEVADGLNSQHRRNVSRAMKAGISLRRTRDEAACSEHLKMMDASMERRVNRGEEIEKDKSDAHTRALLSSGAGELFQAVHENKTVSSALILRAALGAYYHTSGTSPDGMKLGASPFLLTRTAEVLKQEGCRVFNLGGATSENPGLQRFKSGFGARQVALEAASFCPRSEVERKVHSTLRMGWEWIKQ